MQIPINKEIRHYQEEIFLGLNLRQMICSGAAIAVAVAVLFGADRCWVMKRRAGSALWPLRRLQQRDFLLPYDCLTFEKFLLVVIDSTIIRNDWRLWKTEKQILQKKKR